MKIIAIVIVVAAVLLGAWELAWRYTHPPAQVDGWSGSESHSVEVRRLPRSDSESPSGLGVYLTPRTTLLHPLQSELLFAGDCSTMGTRWTSSRQLQVLCELAPSGKEPYRPRDSVDGITLKFVILRPRAAA
jgi:hypothetical protein